MLDIFVEEREQEDRLEMFRDYVGQTLWVINSIQHLKTTSENKMPQYVELSHPERKLQGPQTAEEVYEYVLNGLG